MANKPNNPELWSRAKSMAKQKFDVYPSAYANGWAAKWYKSKGGTWRKAEYGMQIPMMEQGGKPEWLIEAQLKAQGFSGPALQQKMASMAEGGEKMPPEIARARFAAAGNLDKLDDYGYAFGGYVPQLGYGGAALTDAIDRLQKREDRLVAKGYKAVDEGRDKKADRILGRAARVEDRKIRLMDSMAYGGMTYPYMQQGGEPDGEMALGQIGSSLDKLMRLRELIQPDSDLEPWVNSKLTMIDDYTDAVSDYMMFNPEAQEMMMMEPGDEMEMMRDGGIPQRYKNMGFTKTGVKKKSTRPGKKWMVLAEKDGKYKVVHGGWKGMDDFSQHGSEKRKERFWDRMGGRNSAKAKDPFSPLYWHKRFGTWEQGGEIPEMKKGGSTWSGNTWYRNGGSYAMLPFAQEGMQAEAVPPPPMPYEFPDHGSYQSALQTWTSMYGDPAMYDYSQIAAVPDTLPAAPVVTPGAAPVAAVPTATASKAPALNPYDGGSIYDFMKAQGKSPDFQSRKSLAKALGISGYRGTSDQNLALMEMIQENPAILLNYTGQGQNAFVPSQQRTLPGKASAEQEVAAEESEVLAPEVQNAVDTISTVVQNLPDSTKQNASGNRTDSQSTDSFLKDVLNTVAGLGAVGGGLGISYVEYSNLMDMIRNNQFAVPPAMKGKLLESLDVLRNNALQTGTSAVKSTMESYYGPQESIARLRGRLAQNIANRTNAALSASYAEDDYIRAMEEAEAAAKAKRVENARRASQARWAKVKGTQPAGTTAATATASAAENTAQAMANTDEMIDVARAADGTADLVPAGSRLSNMNAAARNFFSQNRIGRNVAGMTRAVANETPWIRWARTNVPRALKFLRSFEDGGSTYLPSFQTKGEVKIKDIIKGSKTREQHQAEYEQGEANDKDPFLLELIDPTGVTSWDDFDRVWNNPNSGFWDRTLATVGVVPVLGKVGKAGKIFNVISDASQLSRGQRAVNTGKKVVNVAGRTADVLSGAPVVRAIDRMNPLTHAVGYGTSRVFANAPRVMNMFQIVNDINRGNRGVNAMNAIADQYFRNTNNKVGGYVSVPVGDQNEVVNISDSDEIGLIMPDGSRMNTTWSDPRVAQFWRDGMIDTTASGAFVDTSGGRQRFVYKIKGPSAKKKKFGGYIPEMFSQGGMKKANFARNFAKQVGGPVVGQEMDVTPEQLEMLKAQGYKFEII